MMNEKKRPHPWDTHHQFSIKTLLSKVQYEAGSRNPPPQLSPLSIQLRTVSKLTAYGERLGDDAMGMQGRRASLAGVLAGGVSFVPCVLL